MIVTLIGMKPEQLAKIEPADIGDRLLRRDEVIYFISNLPGCFAHAHCMEKLKAGKPGIHPILRKGQHSDRFINVKEAMQKFPNFRRVMASQLARLIKRYIGFTPDYIVGVPSAAVELGADIAGYLGVEFIPLKKVTDTEFAFDLEEGVDVPMRGICAVVDDVVTTGDGRTVADKFLVKHGFVVLPAWICVIKRCQRENIISLGDYIGEEWWPENGQVCERCAAGSLAEKPKTSEEAWQRYITSQA